jgi:uncharacterized membrane protein SpoIIM required for sporulation
LALDYWKNSSSWIKRILSVLGFFVFSLVITIAGVLTPLSAKEAVDRSDELKQLQDEIKSMDVWNSAISIFKNNFMMCLLMFIPIAGPFIGSYVLYNTGVMIAAESNVANVPGLLVFLFLIILPFAWLEFIAYSTAFAGSTWLTWRTIQRRGRREILRTCVLIAACAVILLVAAIVEALMIASGI